MAITLAECGSSSIRAISPKKSPVRIKERMTSLPSSEISMTLTWPDSST